MSTLVFQSGELGIDHQRSYDHDLDGARGWVDAEVSAMMDRRLDGTSIPTQHEWGSMKPPKPVMPGEIAGGGCVSMVVLG